MASYRFGKHPKKSDYRTLQMGNYMEESLAPPPNAYSVLDNVYGKLKVSDPSVLFPMDGNDQYGDCTIAALAHSITVFRGLVGKKSIMSKSAVTKLYMHLTGGVDSGMNELDVLNYWRKHSVSGDEILAYVSINPKNHDHVKQAMKLFGGVYIGFQCQQACLQDFEAHKVWTPGKLTNDGHAVYAGAYNPQGVTVLTWGSTQNGTWEWWDECVEEAYSLLPLEAKDPNFAPGFNLIQLQSDLAEVAH